MIVFLILLNNGYELKLWFAIESPACYWRVKCCIMYVNSYFFPDNFKKERVVKKNNSLN